jgi:hypothetical protein
MAALGNFITAVSPNSIVSLCVLPHRVHLLWDGSHSRRSCAAIYKISSWMDMKWLVGRARVHCWCACWRAKSNTARRPTTQAPSPLCSPSFFWVRRHPSKVHGGSQKPEKSRTSRGEIAVGQQWVKTR